jgi:hypothetical protein
VDVIKQSCGCNQFTTGIALRDPARRVHFLDDATGLWQTLTDADAPALTLLGRLDLYEAQWRADGDVFTWIERRNTEHARVAERRAA